MNEKMKLFKVEIKLVHCYVEAPDQQTAASIAIKEVFDGKWKSRCEFTAIEIDRETRKKIKKEEQND